MKKRSGVAVLGTTALIGVAGVASVPPTVSRTDVETRLRDFGVPKGAEVVAAQAVADGGTVLTVIHRDESGELHTLGGVVRQETPPPD